MTAFRIALLLTGLLGAALATADPLDGVTFSSQPGTLYVPLREVAGSLGLDVTYDVSTRQIAIGDIPVTDQDCVFLFDDTRLLPVQFFAKAGGTVTQDPDASLVTISLYGREVQVANAPKKVEVSIADQELKAWQGNRLIMATHISSGRKGHETPLGSFKAGPVKTQMHYSRLYDNAPMPWSVQVSGDVFIHGYSTVPRRPASHGCIRMPLTGKNAAKWFYDWVDIGTPVAIVHEFSAAASTSNGGQ